MRPLYRLPYFVGWVSYRDSHHTTLWSPSAFDRSCPTGAGVVRPVTPTAADCPAPTVARDFGSPSPFTLTDRPLSLGPNILDVDGTGSRLAVERHPVVPHVTMVDVDCSQSTRIIPMVEDLPHDDSREKEWPTFRAGAGDLLRAIRCYLSIYLGRCCSPDLLGLRPSRHGHVTYPFRLG